jgi:hypothetical protein
VPLFPPETPVTVLIDGRPLAAYVGAYVAGGRVFAPVSPLLTGLADRVWFDGGTLVIERGQRRVRVQLVPPRPAELNGTYVAAGAVLRALGASVRYEPASHRLIVRLPARGALASPTPFNPAAASAPPSTVFTPSPPSTPRPIWTGSPLPRRTPLPMPPPRKHRMSASRAR